MPRRSIPQMKRTKMKRGDSRGAVGDQSLPRLEMRSHLPIDIGRTEQSHPRPLGIILSHRPCDARIHPHLRRAGGTSRHCTTMRLLSRTSWLCASGRWWRSNRRLVPIGGMASRRDWRVCFQRRIARCMYRVLRQRLAWACAPVEMCRYLRGGYLLSQADL